MRAGWPTVTFALLAVIFGVIGNIYLNPTGVSVFVSYFLIFGGAVLLMFIRVQILRAVLFVARNVLIRVKLASERVYARIHSKVDEINDRVVVYFTRGDDIAMLNRAALYVMENEQTKHLKVVHVYNEATGIAPRLSQHLHVIDRLYPQLRIDLVTVKGSFGPELIEMLARRLRVPKNYMSSARPATASHFGSRSSAEYAWFSEPRPGPEDLRRPWRAPPFSLGSRAKWPGTNGFDRRPTRARSTLPARVSSASATAAARR